MNSTHTKPLPRGPQVAPMGYGLRGPYDLYNGYPLGEPGPELVRVNSLIGDEVRNLADGTRGRIKDIMLDVRTGHASHVVLAFGGFLTLGESSFTVPWTALTLDGEGNRCVRNVAKERVDTPSEGRQTRLNALEEAWVKDFHAH